MATARFFTLLAVAFLTLFAAKSFASPTSRILDGEDAVAGKFPYVASIRLDNAHICGGTIIGEKHILTAAHCVANGVDAVANNRISVRVGSINQFAGGKLVYISQITIHPDYDLDKNNIAILTLERNLIASDKTEVIPIAVAAADVPPVDASVGVAGWGEQSTGATPYKLQSTNFKVASENACLDAYAVADESVICLSHKQKQGSCHGDAGNGAVYNNKVVGVSNYVIGTCGSIYPDIFLNVISYADWINEVIAVV